MVADGRYAAASGLPIPADQAWFWTPEWQARVAEAAADRLAGRGTFYASAEEFVSALEDW